MAGIDKVSAKLRKKINNVIERRIRKAYPKAVKTESVKKDAGGVFASGCCFYKIMLLFIIGAFLGDITKRYSVVSPACVDEPQQCRVGSV